ncbi:MAG TPA: hypothetical protein VKT71_08240 [Candidatus Acidoferrales bacterium]|nr:hypothetical protein [Candidatus Acidoferrales bacterium]
MKTGRRFFLSGLPGVLTALAAAQALLADEQGPPIQPRGTMNQIPDASGSTSRENSPFPVKANPREQLKQEQKSLRRDVDRLMQLVKELKEESDKTPETDVLSLSLVKKAEDIEKLARQIKDRIRES